MEFISMWRRCGTGSSKQEVSGAVAIMKAVADTVANLEKRRLQKSDDATWKNMDGGQHIYNKTNIGVVKGNIIRQALSPPYTRPNVRMPIQVGHTIYHSPIRTIIRQNLISIPIEEAEKTEDYKQVIPFIVMVNNVDKSVLIRKFDTGVDIHQELASEYSLGLFDHINGGEGIYESLYRIIEEKTGVKSKDISTCLFNGYIYDNPNHVGLIFVARIDLESFKMAEGSYYWISYDEAEKYIEDDLVDEWSKITYEYVLKDNQITKTF
jgi:predicted NUDIX family phosphoesterase